MNNGKFYSQDDRILIIKYLRNQIYNLTHLFFLCQFILKKNNYLLWAIKYPIPNLVDDKEKGKYISKCIWKFYFLMKTHQWLPKGDGKLGQSRVTKSLSPCLLSVPLLPPCPLRLEPPAFLLAASQVSKTNPFTSKALRDWRPHQAQEFNNLAII